MYRLLGVAPFEGDPDVVHAAADGRMGFLKTFQTGANSPVAERLLNEVSRARICLSNPQKRAAYDNVLRSAKPADADDDGPLPKSSKRADIYALGCTLHFLLTGQPPYPGRSMMEKLAAHCTAPIPSLRAKLGNVPANLDQAFTKMLAKDPANRYQFMGDVVSVLEHRRRPNLFRRLLERYLGVTNRPRPS